MKKYILILSLFSLNSFALTIFKCGQYHLNAHLNGVASSYKLIINKDTMSEVEIPVAVSKDADKIIEQISARPINAEFIVDIQDGGTMPQKATIQKIIFPENPLSSTFKLLAEKKCPLKP